MTPQPDVPLTAAMMHRAGDLAHFMLLRGHQIAIASGSTPNGHPCTVIYAVGEWAEPLREVGEKVAHEVAKQNAAAENAAKRN